MTASLAADDRPPARIKAYRLFFPAAMLHAAIVLPLATLAMATGLAAGLASGPAHGGEMLAGYALAVIAGFLLPPLETGRAFALLALWAAGRGATIVGLPAPWIIVPNLLFAAGITLLIVPRLFGAAKKLRNQATAPLVALIATSVTAAVALVASHDTAAARPVLYAAVTLLAALLLFMGGRVTAPVIIGSLNRRGLPVNARIQPRVEGAILLAFIPAVAAQSAALLQPIAAAGTGLAGLLGLLRLLRWTPWRCGARADVLGLGLGHAWVCAGLLLLAAAWFGANVPAILGLHAITVGGLGTLSLNVMGRTWLVRAKVDPAGVRMLAVGSVLITLAAGLRIAAITTSIFALNHAAALAWSLAFIGLLITLLRVENRLRSK